MPIDPCPIVTNASVDLPNDEPPMSPSSSKPSRSPPTSPNCNLAVPLVDCCAQCYAAHAFGLLTHEEYWSRSGLRKRARDSARKSPYISPRLPSSPSNEDVPISVDQSLIMVDEVSRAQRHRSGDNNALQLDIGNLSIQSETIVSPASASDLSPPSSPIMSSKPKPLVYTKSTYNHYSARSKGNSNGNQ